MGKGPDKGEARHEREEEERMMVVTGGQLMTSMNKIIEMTHAVFFPVRRQQLEKMYVKK